MKKTVFFGVFSAVLAALVSAADVDCLGVSLSVKKAVAAEQSKVLEVVSREVAASPGCACEIVKSAIEASSAKPELVSSIVEAAVTAAPDQIRIFPGDTVEGFQSASDVQGGGSSSSSGSVNGGSLFGGSGTPGGVNFPPVIINPPKVTEADPKGNGKKP